VLRWRHTRTAAQSLLLVLAALVVLDGLHGPQLAPTNLAGTLPWVHWRGFVVLALLVAGNAFCFACPFMLPRRVAKRILPAALPWPRVLRTKWLAVALLLLFFWGYEAFALWSSPWLTAWVIVVYFVGAFVVDGFFRGAAFCKHVCPIGQFHFVHSTLSPLEVSVRSPSVCASCTTKDCITGRYEAPVGRSLPLVPELAAGGRAVAPPPGSPSLRGRRVQSGCELWLFQERKVGNLDCTFCLDCIHACPHENVGILGREPGRELWEDPFRSGVGRLSRRPDLAALAVVLTFAAFVNAFGMVTPVYGFLEWLGRVSGVGNEPVLLGIVFVAGLGLLPLSLVMAAAAATRLLTGSPPGVRTLATRYAWGLLPVGFGMWVAHYLFHFLIGALTIVPVVQQYLLELGLPSGGPPRWGMGAIVPEGWLLPLNLLFLELGLLVSLLVTYRIARALHGDRRSAVAGSLPWWGLALALSGAGIWLLIQPMEMRGTFLG